MQAPVVIHWFRQDLRLTDNPALKLADQAGAVLPVFILDDENAGDYHHGAASRWWLHHALVALNQDLAGNLRVFKGDPESILIGLVKEHKVSGVYWNRCYEPWRIHRDKRIKSSLKTAGAEVVSCNGSLLWEPWQILKKDGSPYKVFTPFYRKGCLNAKHPRFPAPAPEKLTFARFDRDTFDENTIEDLALLPDIRWDKQLESHWKISEHDALDRLSEFIETGLNSYQEGRNFPAKKSVSRLSPYLHWGQISPNQFWYEVKNHDDSDNADRLLSELGWREFSHSLLYHFPDLPRSNLQTKFDHFPWLDDRDALRRWQQGLTGYPLVDAGMRELWQTGYMHNRVRMVVGSFLVKNLLLHWHHGEAWFWDCLVDADLANNSASWQWIAGCGADAAPYFRIFNPVTQGEKFDPCGDYTRSYVPELEGLPDKYLYKPWQAPAAVLKSAGITLGKDYPLPIVDVKDSRKRALEAFKQLSAYT